MVAAAASRTPPWLHRLHAKRGLSFPSNLQIDDVLYGQCQILHPPPPSSSSPKELSSPKAKQPKKKGWPPRGNYPSLPNPSKSNPSSPQLQISTIVADLLVSPSSTPLANMPIKAFHKQNHPRLKHKKSSCLIKESMDKAKIKKHRYSEHTADPERERCISTDVTVIDTSIHGWKATKLLLHRGDIWVVDDKKGDSEYVVLTKDKRRAGLVSKIRRDREKKDKDKEKEATSSGNIHDTSGDEVKELDCPI